MGQFSEDVYIFVEIWQPEELTSSTKRAIDAEGGKKIVFGKS